MTSISTAEHISFSMKSDNSYGMHVVSESLRRHGIECLKYQEMSDNPLLASLYWLDNLFDLAKLRMTEGPDRMILSGGNYATTSPQAVLLFSDFVFLGDGDNWDGALGSKYIVSEHTTQPAEKCVAKTINPVPFSDLQDTKRGFCEISRGCKNKCLFCQYGWLKPYRETDLQDIVQVLKRTKTKSVRLFAADRFQHSSYSEIRTIMDNAGKNDTGSDCSIKYILENRDVLGLTRKVRTGIEGYSERLRRLCGKNLPNEDILTASVLIVEAGIKSFDWYMIYGLPTETNEDFAEFMRLLDDLQDVFPDDYVLAIHMNAFTPSAQTPFQWEAPASKESMVRAKRLGEMKRRRYRISVRPVFTSCCTLERRMLGIRAGASSKRLVKAVANARSKFNTDGAISACYNELTGLDLMSGCEPGSEMPWDRFVRYDAEKMLSIRNRNFDKYGRI